MWDSVRVKLSAWIGVQGASLVLVLAGAFMLVAAIFVISEREAVSVTLVVMGAGTLILGALSSRAEGPISVGPEGLKLVLRAVQLKGQEREFTPDQIAEAELDAIDIAARYATRRPATVAARVGIPTPWVRTHATDALLVAAPIADAIAEAAIRQVQSKYVSVSKKSDIWYGNVHKPTESGTVDIMPAFVRVEDGTWREQGKKDGKRPDPQMEQLLEWAKAKAEEEGKTELRARLTEQGFQVME